MDLYELIAREIVLPLSARRENSKYLLHLDELEASQYKNPSDVESYQWECIGKLLRHAYSNCHYYKKKFEALDIHPADIRDHSDFARIPILSRQDIILNLNDLVAQNYHKDKLIPGITSGSTGEPLRFYYDFEAQQFRRACIVRNNRWAGWELGRKMFSIYGDTPFHKENLKSKLWNLLVSRNNNLNSLKLTESSMLDFYKKVRREKTPFIYGHAHNLYIFARFLKNRKIDNLQACGIISGGMNLNEWERREIEDVFNCKVLNRYGCEELSLIASECPHQEGLHLNTDLHYVEIIKKCDDDEFGSLVITDLKNYAMPLIRYRVGDVGAFSNRNCSCGRSQPLMERIMGRESEFVITPENKLVSGISLTDNFGCMIDGIKQLQIIQNEKNHLLFRIVRTDIFSEESFKKIDELVRKYFGNQMKFDCDFLDNIPADGSGKYRFIISRLSKDYFNYI